MITSLILLNVKTALGAGLHIVSLDIFKDEGISLFILLLPFLIAFTCRVFMPFALTAETEDLLTVWTLESHNLFWIFKGYERPTFPRTPEAFILSHLEFKKILIVFFYFLLV